MLNVLNPTKGMCHFMCEPLCGLCLSNWLCLVGFCIDVGTRDETGETSGSLLALKNTYLKTLKHTNETINYGMI